MASDKEIGEISNSAMVMPKITSANTASGITAPDVINGTKHQYDAPSTITESANFNGVFGCFSPIFVHIAAIKPENSTTHRLCSESFHDTGMVKPPMLRLAVSSKYTVTDVNT